MPTYKELQAKILELQKGPAGAVIGMTSSGWLSDTKLLLQWFDHFINYLPIQK